MHYGAVVVVSVGELIIVRIMTWINFKTASLTAIRNNILHSEKIIAIAAHEFVYKTLKFSNEMHRLVMYT